MWIRITSYNVCYTKLLRITCGILLRAGPARIALTKVNRDLRQSTDLRALVFGGEAFAEESARLQARLTELQQACEQFVPPAPPVVSPLQGQLTVDKDDKAFCADVERLKGNIRKGDIFQVA